jgi:hypothetical protein
MVQDFASWRIVVWIGKPRALEGQFLPTAKWIDPPKSKVFNAMTHLKSDLMEFIHPLD